MLALKVIGIFHVSKKVLWSPVMAGETLSLSVLERPMVEPATPVNAGGSGASNSGWTARTGAAEPPAKTLRHAHRRRLLRFDRTIQQGRSRAGRQRLPTQTAVARFSPYRPPGKRKRETLPLLQRRIGHVGKRSERWSGACKQQKGRAAFDLRDVPAPSHLLEQQKSDKSIAGEPALVASARAQGSF